MSGRIEKYVKNKMSELFVVNLDFPDSEKTNFFSSKIGLAPRDVVSLCFELEQELGIAFSENELLSKDMFTIQGITSLIQNKIGTHENYVENLED